MSEETAEMWKVGKLLRGIQNRYWLTDVNGKDFLFKYHEGYAELLQIRFNELWGQWRAKHPYDILNGGDT